jgi:hypothetical protein
MRLRSPPRVRRALERLHSEQIRRWADHLIELGRIPVAGSPPPAPRPGRPPRVVQDEGRLAALSFFLERAPGAGYRPQLEWANDRANRYALSGAWGREFGEFLGMPIVETAGAAFGHRGIAFGHLGDASPTRLRMTNSQFGTAPAPVPGDPEVTTEPDDDVSLLYGPLDTGGRGFSWKVTLKASKTPRWLYIVPAIPSVTMSDFATWVNTTTCKVKLPSFEGVYPGACTPATICTDATGGANLYVGVIIEGDKPEDPDSKWGPRSAGAFVRATL